MDFNKIDIIKYVIHKNLIYKNRIHQNYLNQLQSNKIIMTPQEEFSYLFKRMYRLCDENNWGDPFSYARSREIHLANKLKNKISDTYSGCDAIDEDGGCEYKTTIGKNISATYNGISVKSSWEEQLKYLENDKICKYKNHYFARYKGSKIIEVYKMDCKKVLEGLLPHIKKKYNDGKKRADPRLGHTFNKKYIIENSIKIF